MMNIRITRQVQCIIINFLITIHVHTSHGQLQAEVPESTTKIMSSTPAVTTPLPVSSIAPPPPTTLKSKPTTELRICNSDDVISNTYCKCSKNVVSCDFSQFIPISDKKESDNSTIANISLDHHTNLVLNGYAYPKETKRLCICNAPPNLHLTFTKDYFLPLRNSIHRFDLYNLSGLVNLTGGFNLNFNGEIYMSSITQLLQIDTNEFARGNDMPIDNVQDLQCCSVIRVNQDHDKPVLFIEKTNIGAVRPRGISDDHLWKTLIFKQVGLKNVDQFGIIFDSYAGFNVAILRCTIEDTSEEAMIFQSASNVFLSNNNFTKTVNPEGLACRTNLNNSNILLFNNVFWNGFIFNKDARKIIGWFNAFNLWDSHTFAYFNTNKFTSSGTERLISFKYNRIDKTKMDTNATYTLDKIRSTNFILEQNVLGRCNCSVTFNPEIIQEDKNYCYSGSVKKKRQDQDCSINLDKALAKCDLKAQASNNFQNMCSDKSISLSAYPDGSKEKDVKLIKSDFIKRIVDEFAEMFNPEKISKLRGLLEEVPSPDLITNGTLGGYGGDEGGGHTASTQKKKSSAVVPVIVTVFVVVFVVVVGLFVFKNRFRYFRRHGHESLLEEDHHVLS